jgi:hypothetical protein
MGSSLLGGATVVASEGEWTGAVWWRSGFPEHDRKKGVGNDRKKSRGNRFKRKCEVPGGGGPSLWIRGGLGMHS